MSDEPEDLAGAYVLGTLDAAEMRAVREQAAHDPALADAIAAWEARLAPLSALAPPVAPPEGLWERIEASAGTAAANDNRFARLWRNAGLWRATTAAAMALAAAFAAVAVLRPRAPLAVASLEATGAPGATFLARVSRDGAVVLRPLTQVSVPAGHDLELWALAAGAHVPVPLGVMTPDGAHAQLANLPAAGTQIMVSLEAKGGSSTGLPSGPVLYAGRLALVD